jgi:hypothetical protein
VQAPFKIAYAAHTNSCTFLLDGEGFCRQIVLNPSLSKTVKGREAEAVARRCIGAQYVASLDGSLPGLLAEMPRVGIPMVFARVDERGRVALVRTGKVTRFDSEQIDQPFAEVAPSVSVETSAPPMPPLMSEAMMSETKTEETVAVDVDDDDVTLARTADFDLPPAKVPTTRDARDARDAAKTLRRVQRTAPAEPRHPEVAAGTSGRRWGAR